MSQKSLSNDGNQTDTQEELDILRYIPEDVLSEMNEEAIYIVRNVKLFLCVSLVPIKHKVT